MQICVCEHSSFGQGENQNKLQIKSEKGAKPNETFEKHPAHALQKMQGGCQNISHKRYMIN